jgi:hypothetical protein
MDLVFRPNWLVPPTGHGSTTHHEHGATKITLNHCRTAEIEGNFSGEGCTTFEVLSGHFRPYFDLAPVIKG